MEWCNLMTTEIKIGDSRQLIHELEDNSVDCVMTSPPYWALRDYGHNDQIGMEDTPEDYLNNMLNLFNDIKTKLKNTGNCFVNLGDTYASNTKGSGGTDKQQINGSDRQHFNSLNVKSNLPNKCMCMIPERFAWGMIQNGWILRNKIVWYKPNHMPEPVTDRLTKSYEMIYHFTKSQKYYYDLDAIREPHITQEKRPSGMVRSQNYNGKYKGSTINPEISSSPRARTQRQYSVVERINDVVEYRKNLPELIDLKKYLNKYKAQSNLTIDNIENIFGNKSPHHWLNGECYPSSEDWIKLKTILNFDDMYDIVMTTLYQKKSDKINNPKGKNPGDMWAINTKPYSEAHFAVYPLELVKKPILAGCPVGGTVLDPFGGSGTTAEFCRNNDRNCIIFELNPEYEKLIKKRSMSDIPELTQYIQ
jgi:DNA modification methylase